MTEPEFSVKKFRKLLEEKAARRLANWKAGSVYWVFYYHKGSPLHDESAQQILAMTDEEILEAYARWRIET